MRLRAGRTRSTPAETSTRPRCRYARPSTRPAPASAAANPPAPPRAANPARAPQGRWPRPRPPGPLAPPAPGTAGPARPRDRWPRPPPGTADPNSHFYPAHPTRLAPSLLPPARAGGARQMWSFSAAGPPGPHAGRDAGSTTCADAGDDPRPPRVRGGCVLKRLLSQRFQHTHWLDDHPHCAAPGFPGPGGGWPRRTGTRGRTPGRWCGRARGGAGPVARPDACRAGRVVRQGAGRPRDSGP